MAKKTRLDQDAVPRPKAGVDVSALPLSADEGYFFSRIDGVMNVGELGAACGLDDDKCASILDKLTELGAVDMSVEAGDEGSPSDTSSSGQRPKKGPTDGTEVTHELKTRISEMLVRAERSNFYEFLGVPPNAERGDIRSAYFALSKEFHPDSYYGKDLGKWRSKMETVFAKLTDAYETLSRKQRRAKYDEYIADQIKAWEMEQRLARIPSLMVYRPEGSGEEEEPEVTEPSFDEPAPVFEEVDEPPPEPAKPKKKRPAARLGPESDLHRRLREQKRKRALSNLLKATGAASATPVPQAAETTANKITPQTSQQKLALQYAVAGADALERKEYMTALNYFELAVQISPDDQNIQASVDKAREQTSMALAGTYERQGAFEEEIGQHVRAAQSYMRALDVRTNDSALMERAAINLLKGSGNLKKARDLATRAVGLEPNNIDYHLTLGEILLSLGQADEAGEQLDFVRRVDPGNDRLARLTAGGRT